MPALKNKETGHRLQCDFENLGGYYGSDETFLLTVSGPDGVPIQCEFRAYEAEHLMRRMLANRWRSLPEMEFCTNNPISVADVVDGVNLRVSVGDQAVAVVFLSDKQRRDLITLLGGNSPQDVRQGKAPASAQAATVSEGGAD